MVQREEREHVFQFTAEGHQKDPLKAFWVCFLGSFLVQAFLLDVQMMEVARSRVHKTHAMLPAPPPQTIQPTSQTHMQSHGSESLQGALTSFH